MGRLPHGRRGLKLILVVYPSLALVSPPAWEAWIETHHHGFSGNELLVASRMGGVD